jgi:hypothetical protein
MNQQPIQSFSKRNRRLSSEEDSEKSRSKNSKEEKHGKSQVDSKNESEHIGIIPTQAVFENAQQPVIHPVALPAASQTSTCSLATVHKHSNKPAWSQRGNHQESKKHPAEKEKAFKGRDLSMQFLSDTVILKPADNLFQGLGGRGTEVDLSRSIVAGHVPMNLTLAFP